MCTKLIKKISGKEFYEIVLGKDREINSEERLEEHFGNLYMYLTDSIWCAKTKYPHTRSANDGLFEIELENGEDFYVLQECKLKDKDKDRALCQLCVYYNMEPIEIQSKIKYFAIITSNRYIIIPVHCLMPTIKNLFNRMSTISTAPCKIYDEAKMDIFNAYESYKDYAKYFYWRTLEDMGDIIKALITI